MLVNRKEQITERLTGLTKTYTLVGKEEPHLGELKP